MRVLPTLHRHSRRVGDGDSAIDFRNFWDFRGLGLRPYIRAAPKTFAVTAAPTSVAFPISPHKPNANSAASCARGAAGPRNDGFEGPHRYGEFLNCAGNAASAAEVAAVQRPSTPTPRPSCGSQSLDARRLGNVTPKALASEELWPGGAPQWARDAWLEMQAVLGNSRGKSLLGGFLPRSDKPNHNSFARLVLA